MVYSVITEWKCAAKIKHSSLRMHGNRTRENWTHTAIQVIYDKKNMRVLLFLLTVGFFFFFHCSSSLPSICEGDQTPAQIAQGWGISSPAGTQNAAQQGLTNLLQLDHLSAGMRSRLTLPTCMILRLRGLFLFKKNLIRCRNSTRSTSVPFSIGFSEISVLSLSQDPYTLFSFLPRSPLSVHEKHLMNASFSCIVKELHQKARPLGFHTLKSNQSLG